MLWCVLIRHSNVLIHPNYNVPGLQSQDAQKIKEKMRCFVGLCKKIGKSLEYCHNMAAVFCRLRLSKDKVSPKRQ